MDLYNDLKVFYRKLERYRNRQNRRDKGGFTEAQDRNLNALRLELQRDYGRLGDEISQYGGQVGIRISDKYVDAFFVALQSLDMEPWDFEALDGAINIVNQAIGKLEAKGESRQTISDKPKFMLKRVWRKPWNFIIVGIPVLAALIYVIDYFFKLFSK